jgi:hypothetical protein
MKCRAGISGDTIACAMIITAPNEVREKFKRVKPLKEIGVNERG